MGNSSLFNIDDIWQSVALEERLELISKCQASGLIAAIVNMFVMGSIAYGFDKIWLLAAAVGGSFFVFPLFSSFTWRNGKPSIILAYLAVRTISRRFAYSYDFSNIDIILIFKGQMKEIYDTKEEEVMEKQKQDVDFDYVSKEFQPVWIVLMRSGILLLSEKRGGAKVEFITHLTHENTIVQSNEVEPNEKGCIIDGSLQNKGRRIMLKSKYKAAHYVFEKRYESLIEECKKTQDSLEKLRRKG